MYTSVPGFVVEGILVCKGEWWWAVHIKFCTATLQLVDGPHLWIGAAPTAGAPSPLVCLCGKVT